MRKEINSTIKDVFNNKFKGVKLPSRIKFYEDIDYIIIELNKSESGGKDIHNTNMQDVNVAFEGWAIALYTYYVKDKINNKKIKLEVELDTEWKDIFYPQNGHYARFLYRLLKFKGQYDWFEVSDELQIILKNFEEFCFNNKGYLINNLPNKLENITENDKEFINTEHDVEMAMIGREKKKLCSALGVSEDVIINHQLPVGLFMKEVHEKTNIFTKGKSALDMWMIYENKFYMMELKYENKMIGIITEAFFYINYMRDLLDEEGIFTLNCNEMCENRGYNILIENLYKCKKYCAVMIADKFHPLVNDEIITVLNDNNLGIEYFHLIKYNVKDSRIEF